ncbi:lipopolysaccharide transport system ATP-binding protein [Gillisia mitskevichiae]|uniref:Lipopolysaccharide transport system ATP-binding protein n=1 Tax=Gillisia mitskevichiae TaxID=270921 RepID=A0A495P4H9_9FLAO|nr:ABC transporter ATP-binding protein [Gillisia mitskevichiae]RKS45127.1 lipopolysaccharide transport system ATP-binding protein [Gillisia mitskevichiae]
MSIILKAENISKQYRLGQVGTGTLGHDLNRWWAGLCGKEDPYLKVGALNDRSSKATEDYVWALQDINFEVKQGEVLGIIGKNGAGKSTLLKILSRVTSPTTGSIKTRGRIASLLEVGTGFHGELTGRENIFMNGAVLGMSKTEIKRKLDEIIDFSGCEMYIDTPVKRYSSGMTVRLGFAVAAHLEPEILVVDEVLAVGDAEFQKKAIGKMKNLAQGEGRTVLFVSHNMASVKSLCDRGIVLENGSTGYEGNSKDAVDFYLRKKVNLKKSLLIDRKDRVGSGKIRVEDIQLLNENFESIEHVISGEMLIIKVSIKKFEEIKYSKLRVAINFQNNQEDYVLSFIDDEMGANFENLAQKDYFYLKIPQLLLRGDKYDIRIFLSEVDTNPENFLDVIQNAMEVNVLPGDIWKTGRINRIGGGAILPANFLFDE